MLELEKLPTETELDYHKRLVYGKLVDRTLADEDYVELSAKVYGKEYSSDVARRMMYGSCRTLQLMEKEIETSSISHEAEEVIEKLNTKKQELQKERQKLYDQRREYNKLLNKSGRREYLEDCLSEAAHDLDTSIGKLEWLGDADATELSDEAVLVLCDWHYGMVTDNIWNSYNIDTCISRVKDVVSMASRRIKNHKCKKLHIVVLGDLIHGAIHTSARVASEELVCNQIMQVSEILAQAINELSKCVSETEVYMTYGNHARTVQDKNDSIHGDNMEQIIPWWLKQRFSSREDIKINSGFDNEFLFFKVAGYSFCASHGDLDGVKSSPRLLSALFQKKYKADIDYVLLADKHHRETFEELGITAMTCSALCGTDDYANDKRFFSSPEQNLLIVSEENGVDAEYHLRNFTI